MKFISHAILFVLFSYASTSFAGETASWRAKEILAIINGNFELHQSWIKKASSSERFIKNALKAGRELEERSDTNDVTRIEALMIELLSTRYSIEGRWLQKNNFIENATWTDNRIIDPNRFELGKVSFRQVQSKNTVQYDISRGLTIEGQRSSLLRMKDGLAPIGPDGKPILLCRMFNTPKSSFFEITETESGKFIAMTNSGMSKQDACISYSSANSKYWKLRLKTLYDNNNVIINYSDK
jgi:hypothetical protein